MFLYRSLTVGLLGACCFLLMRRPMIGPLQISMPTPPSIAAAQPATTPLRVIDVAKGAAPDQAAQLVKLAPDEHIASVDDIAVTDPINGLLLLMTSTSRGDRSFVDLTIAGDAGERRVLLLMH
jgi:hypothetical protein